MTNPLKLNSHYLAFAANALILGSAIIILRWTFFPMHPFEFQDEVRVITPVVKAGELLVYEMDYCKGPGAADLIADVKYSLQDDLVYHLAGSYSSPLPTGCHTATESLIVPDIPAGKYQLVVSRRYHINPIREPTYTSMSNTFEIAGFTGCVGCTPPKIERPLHLISPQRVVPPKLMYWWK